MTFIPAERHARPPCPCDPQSFSLSIHSRIYGAQFSSFTPSASQLAKKHITSRSTTVTSFRSKTMARRSVWCSNDLLNSAIAGVSIRPLSANTVNGPRAALSILKVIGRTTSQRGRGAAVPHRIPSKNRSQAVQPNIQLHFTENRARKKNWSDRILGSARIPGVQRMCLPDGVFVYLELLNIKF
jgi:hypothetical protein